MIYKLRYLFVFLFVFSVFSITLQASIINLCKENKVFKALNQNNPITEEEEEESHDTDEVIYLAHHHHCLKLIVLTNLFNNSFECNYISFTKSIPLPPPKF